MLEGKLEEFLATLSSTMDKAMVRGLDLASALVVQRFEEALKAIVPLLTGVVHEDGALTRHKFENKLSWLSKGTRADFFDVKAIVESGQQLQENMEADIAEMSAKFEAMKASFQRAEE
eukprot:11457228-Prorocentrum_lima.AAC.1